MTSDYLQGQVRTLLDALERDGIEGIDELARHRLAYFFVQEAVRDSFEIHSDDRQTVINFITHCRTAILESPDYQPTLDHKTGLRHDAAIIRQANRPVGALVLYATWIEHWANGVMVVAASKKKLAREDITQLLRTANMQAKLGWLLPFFGLPPLPEERRGPLLHINDLRNEYVHYKWFGVAAQWGDPDVRLQLAVEGAESHLRYLVAYAVENLYEPAVTVAERILKVEYREWMPFFL